ncbi:MAG: hypothetical protein AAF483_15735, partial [Planctomycetota bacterium]
MNKPTNIARELHATAGGLSSLSWEEIERTKGKWLAFRSATFAMLALIASFSFPSGCPGVIAQDAPSDKGVAALKGAALFDELDQAALESRIAGYSDSTKGDVHAERNRRSRRVSRAFVAGLIARKHDIVGNLCAVPFHFAGEHITEDAVMRERIKAVLLPKFKGKTDGDRRANSKLQQIALADTIEHLEQMLGEKVSATMGDELKRHLRSSSRIALVLDDGLLWGLSLVDKGNNTRVNGLIFSHCPREGEP